MVEHVRPATAADLPALQALLAPEIALGTILPREVQVQEFLVAVGHDGVLLGAVGMSHWSDHVVELGSLVSGRRGLGVGQLLVDAVRVEAARRGASTVVALTSLQDWFQRRGFRVHPMAPWQLARSVPTLLSSDRPDLNAAVAHKASTSCASCPLLARCAQRLMVADVTLPFRQVA